MLWVLAVRIAGMNKEQHNAILKVDNLTKIHAKGTSLESLSLTDVSFSVTRGESIAIVSPSGSGKSTLLHLIAGIDKPTSGKICVDGNEITQFSESKMSIFRRRNIGIVYLFYNLISGLTVEENILLPYLLYNRSVDHDRLEQLLKTVELWEKRDFFPRHLSGGQQQRASAIRALINDPAILLADEPTGNLDSRNGRALMDLLRMANRNYGQTLLTVTHDESIALRADRIITLEDGRIVGDEPVR